MTDDDARDRAAAAAAAAAEEGDSSNSNSNSNSGCGDADADGDGAGDGDGGAAGDSELKKIAEASEGVCGRRRRTRSWWSACTASARATGPPSPRARGLARSGKSCRLRWVKHLSPAIRPGPLSEAEQRQVIQLQKRFGNKWALMAQHMPGRSDNAIKNFWNSYRKRMQRRVKAAAVAARDGGMERVGEKEEQALVCAGHFMMTPAPAAAAAAAAAAASGSAAASPILLLRPSTVQADHLLLLKRTWALERFPGQRQQ
ncbi:hypothetical protein CLOP_g20130 [Closterium sp. NIES-67]|nr:hypothetical protein CLOP_g20130 [Closterium sp. NIES-67]